jgi:3-hydroxy-9,10-secoandrosta-1,3,5(10)-triene-9,17-dione monooxygenase reductase component
MSFDPKQFRQALGSFATGITIVTTRDEQGVDVGMTANSFNSVSLEPPMILWSLAKSSYSLPVFMAAEHFAVHVLAAEQDALSSQFARRGIDKFTGLTLARGRNDIPLLADYAARFQCRTAFRYEGGDHVIFVGEVLEYDHTPRAPLLYHGGRYALALPLEKTPDPIGEPDSSFSQDFLIYLLGRAHHQLFLELRRELQRFGLSEEGWFVLSLLGVSDHRTLVELNQLLAYTGKRVRYELVASLAANDLVHLHGPYDPQVKVSLTDRGRQVVVELVAAGKAFESHAARNLDTGEQQLLKQCLRRLIADTEPDPASQVWLAEDAHGE